MTCFLVYWKRASCTSCVHYVSYNRRITQHTLCAFLSSSTTRRTSILSKTTSPSSWEYNKFKVHPQSTQSTQSTFPNLSRYTSTETLLHSNNNNHDNHYSSIFLDQIEETIQNVLQKHNIPSSLSSSHSTNKERITNVNSILEQIQPCQREAVGVSIHLHNRLYSLIKNNDCQRCWFQKAHCICNKTPSLETKTKQHQQGQQNQNNIEITLPNQSIHRIFLLMHHKEIGMAVDTAKLLLNSFDSSCKLVVNGLDGEYQHSMNDLMDAIQQKERRCMVLFPSEDAMTFSELNHLKKVDGGGGNMKQDKRICHYRDDKWDVIVIDGTWAQARKMYTRYIPKREDNGPYRVCLSQGAVDILDSPNNDCNDSFTSNNNNLSSGRQLRRHPIKWREISTLEATRLMIRDVILEEESNGNDQNMDQSSPTKQYCFDILSKYQFINGHRYKFDVTDASHDGKRLSFTKD